MSNYIDTTCFSQRHSISPRGQWRRPNVSEGMLTSPHGLPKQPITAGPILGPRVRAVGTKRPSGTHISAQMTSSYSSFGKKGDPRVGSSHNPAG
jgi:hypothetical protein